ncbi:MAG: hypothetical protein GFH27_549283n81 [Chloroflexi bacterium AL-W]|nr:hypothetical protein [Chloroflexi bacterium AL-N1]NOK64798.1 hypothetical protein [Chloroflexi bacterium AL-N10]NOK76568.1 hypothetical protein [Chloroflexi bacterium AL-N5]NOK80202.1 hypothetical protein [Chloroflexi bacterium AL-W]NOK86715.1 hypothetical protein [Chloroflexi bacterium AL-N15]
MGQIHPAIQKNIDAFDQGLAAAGIDDYYSAGAERFRAFLDNLAVPPEFLPAIHSVEDRTIPGPAGEIPIRIYRPNDQENLPALVWYHGGGFVIGTLDIAEMNCRRLSNDTECVVISIDYRLAPETRFPGAHEDCIAATAWVAASADELGIDATRIAVGGDSTGGNLAIGVTHHAREHGPPLVFQLLVYPVTDADFDRPSYIENAEGYFLTKNMMEWFWDCYVPDVEQRKHPMASPLRASDFSNLPPAFIITSKFDPLRDEGEAYGAALAAAGVPVETKRYDNTIHGFYNMLTEEPVDEIIAASRDSAMALRQVFGTAESVRG